MKLSQLIAYIKAIIFVLSFLKFHVKYTNDATMFLPVVSPPKPTWTRGPMVLRFMQSWNMNCSLTTESAEVVRSSGVGKKIVVFLIRDSFVNWGDPQR